MSPYAFATYTYILRMCAAAVIVKVVASSAAGGQLRDFVRFRSGR